MLGRGGSSWHSPLLQGGLLGRSWPVLTRAPPTSGFRPEEAATFFAGKVLWGSSVGGFQSQPLEVREFLCWRWQGLSGCTQPASRPDRCGLQGKCRLFIFHLSLQEVGVGGCGEEGRRGQPSQAQAQLQSTGDLRSPSFPPLPAQPCPWAPSWLLPAPQEEGMLGQRLMKVSPEDEDHL